MDESEPQTGATKDGQSTFLQRHLALAGSIGSRSHTAPNPQSIPLQPARQEEKEEEVLGLLYVTSDLNIGFVTISSPVNSKLYDKQSAQMNECDPGIAFIP